MKTTWITLLVSCAFVNAMSQDVLTTYPATYELGISLGLNQRLLLDKNTSPLTYRALQTDIGLHFKYYQNHSMVRIGVLSAIGHIKPADIPGRNVYFQEKDENGESKTIAVPANGNLLSFKLDIGYNYIFNPADTKNRYGHRIEHFRRIIQSKWLHPSGTHEYRRPKPFCVL
ncbi:MAG: hypothetical protein U5K79_26020 [Cyclobacteriaceae bacterium]|nr:hypothetical protein [Cyclobacteriaceae bacterium]